jgi:hypothetical protein
MRSPSGDAHLNRDETAVKMGHPVLWGLVSDSGGGRTYNGVLRDDASRYVAGGRDFIIRKAPCQNK